MGYKYYRQITIDKDKVSGDLVDFPFLFSADEDWLETVVNGGRITSIYGYDIVFSPNADGSSKYDHEIEKYDGGAGQGIFVAHVRIPAVSSTVDTTFYICYGNPSVTTSQENITGVWDGDFKAVWHLGESVGMILDSTSNGNDGVPQDSLPTQVAGKVGDAQRFDGALDSIVVADDDSLDFTTALTIELWMKLAVGSVGGGLVSKQRTRYNQPDGYQLYHHVATDNLDFTGATGDVERCSPSMAEDTWYYVANVYAASAVIQYVNNIPQVEDLAFTAATLIVGADDLRIGERDAATPQPFFEGDIDEVRLSSIGRSVHYMTATYNNQSSPATFYGVGLEVFGVVLGRPQIWTTPEYEGRYHVVVRDTSGTQLALLDDYDEIDYTLRLNDQGYYRLTAATELVDPDNFELDYLVEIHRRPPGAEWSTELTAFHRFKSFRRDEEDKEWLTSVGPGLENLLRRRIILPTQWSAFLVVENQFTDIMRELVRTQCIYPHCSLARGFPGLSVEVDQNQGTWLDLNYRYVNLYDAIHELSGMGADFAIVQTGVASFEFRVYYPMRGIDRSVGNAEDNPPVIFSLGMANMENPIVELDRLEELTVAYVGGEGVGANRQIEERYNIWSGDADARDDSPWNRIECYLEARQQTDPAALMAYGDGHLFENKQRIAFSCRAIPSPGCLYEVHWDIGDYVTGRYKGTDYKMQITEAHVMVGAGGENIDPTFEVLFT